MTKGGSGSDRLKVAGQGASPPSRRRSRGSRGGDDTDEPAVSGSSMQTPFGGRREVVLGVLGNVDGGMAAGEGATLRVQIPESGICTPSIGEGEGGERLESHRHASTSWRCGFQWLSALLAKRLRAWDEEDAKEFDCSIDELYNDPFVFKYVEVFGFAVPHIIGRKGRVIRQLEQTCGVFLTLRDIGNGRHQMMIAGPRPLCILAEFAIQLLSRGQHSVLATLSSLSL